MKMKTMKYIVKNPLYGDKEITGYENRGLITYNQGAGWEIAHVKSGFTLGKPKRTKRGALQMLARLHELGIPWEKPLGSELKQIAALRLDDIKAAVQGYPLKGGDRK